MRKTSYPSKLEPRLQASIVRLDLMSEEELASVRRSWARAGRAFKWPEFLAEGRGSFSGPWFPPDAAGFAVWLGERCRHFGHEVEAVFDGSPDKGSVRFTSSTGATEEGSWTRPARAYGTIESTLKSLFERDGIPLLIEKLEPTGEEYQWVVLRESDFEDFENHLKGEREWHSELSRAFQRFREAAASGDDGARLDAATVGVRAGEMMRKLGADYTYHTRDVEEMYRALGKQQEATRWSRYPHREHARGL